MSDEAALAGDIGGREFSAVAVSATATATAAVSESAIASASTAVTSWSASASASASASGSESESASASAAASSWTASASSFAHVPDFSQAGPTTAAEPSSRAVAPLRIGPHAIWPPIVLAPMSGVTNRTMRALYKPFGFGLTVTEFVSSNALEYGSKRTMEMIDQHGIEKPVSTQLWGADPEIMARAARVVRDCGADIVDINFGCPAPKVTRTAGGSACLRDVDRCEAIMRAVINAVDCPVTIKMRLGWTETDLVYIEVAKRAEALGIAAITLHARTAKQFYRGTADWSHIARLKAAVSIPIIGNGDLHEAEQAMTRMKETGVDAVMIGRAILGNPWIASDLHALMENRPIAGYPPPHVRLQFALVHYDRMMEELGESRAVPQMRKHLGYYLKGFPGASELRERLMRTVTAEETIAIVEAAIARVSPSLAA